MTEFLEAKRRKGKLEVKVYDRKKSRHDQRRYEQIIHNRDPNALAYMLCDLESLGYPIDKAIIKYREMRSGPGLFFLK